MKKKEKPANKSTVSKLVQEKIEVSENKYQSLFENMPSGFVLFEVVLNDKNLPIDLVIVAANERFAATTGLKLKDAIGKHLTHVLPGIEKDAADWIGTYSKVALTGKPKQLEQGSELLGYFYSVTAYKSGLKRCAVIFEDITERKKIESQSFIEKERIISILNLVGNPIFLKDNDHRIIAANRSFFDLFDMDEESVIGKTLAEDIPEKEMQHFFKIDRDVLDTGNPDFREEELTIKGRTHTIITEKKRHIDTSGNKFLVGTIHDITDSKKFKRVLQEQEELLRLSSELANVAAWEMNLVTDSMTRSSNHDKLYGLTEVGQWHVNTFMDATHVDDRDKCNTIINASLEAGGPNQYQFDFRILYPDKSIHWLNVIGEVIERDANGFGIKIRGFINDITYRKEVEIELKNHKEHLEELVKVRTKEIEKKNSTLEKMNNLFVGRELRMKELKVEIEKLKNQS